MNDIRIVYIHQYFNTPAASSSTRSYELAKRLAQRGHDVHVVSTIRDQSKAFRGWRQSTVAGFQLHATHVPYSNSLGKMRRVWAFMRFALLAGLRARRIGGSIVYASSTPLTVAIPARLAVMGRSTPIVFEVRDLWPEVPIALGVLRGQFVKWLAYRLQRFAYGQAAHIVALSPDMKTGVVDSGYPSSQVSVIPNSADLDIFALDASGGRSFRELHPWLGDRPLALYCGTLGRVNHAEYIVHLARAASHTRPEYRFLIVGDGAERDKVETLAAQLGVLNKNLFIFDRVPKTDLPVIYAASTVALSTVAPVEALWANSANKVFDALAAGRPVAINHEGWQADLLRASGAGVIMDPGRPAVALGQLAILMDHPAAARQAGIQARQLALERFSRDDHGTELSTILEAVAESTSRSG